MSRFHPFPFDRVCGQTSPLALSTDTLEFAGLFPELSTSATAAS